MINIAPLPPDQALEYFRNKGLAMSFDWQDALKLQQDIAFTVAGIMQLDVLADIKEFVDESLEKGYTFQQFSDGLTPRLAEKGWLGKKEIENPDTGATRTVNITPYRLKFALETNLRVAYTQGQWSRIQDNKQAFPLLIYVANNSKEPRPEHSALNGIIQPVDSLFWAWARPIKLPGCKCRLRALTASQGAKLGYSEDDQPPSTPKMQEYENKVTGEKQLVPEGVHPMFWNKNSQDYLAGLTKVLEAKKKL